MITNQIINKHGVQITTIELPGEVSYMLSYNAGGGVTLELEVAEILVDLDDITMDDLIDEPEELC